MRRPSNLFVLVACAVSMSSARADDVDTALLLLKSPLPQMRAQTALALGARRSDSARVVVALTQALKDDHRTVRTAAALALGRLGQIEAVGPLADAIADEDPNVSQAAKLAIDKVVTTFVASRSGRSDRHFAIEIRGLAARKELGDPGLTGKFKDLALERLTDSPNVDVGTSFEFEPSNDGQPAHPTVAFDLRGELMTLTTSTCTVRLELRLPATGSVVKRWGVVAGKGATSNDAMRDAVRRAVGNVLGFLGAPLAKPVPQSFGK